MSWVVDLVPLPHTRGPLTVQSFFAELLPPLLCYYATAILVILPDTFPIRLALLPLTLWSTFRAATRIDLVLGWDEPGVVYLNHGLLLALTTLAMRAIAWTFRLIPFKRLKRRTSPEGDDRPTEFSQVALDAFDLFCNLRGLGWDWSAGLQLPAETRPTTSASSFALATFRSFVKHIISFDFLHYSVQSFSPSTVGSPSGGTIFNPSLPPLARYSQSTLITLLSGLTVYCAIQTSYDLFTIISILFLRHHPSQWPPVFDAPWRSTSLTEYWAKRWHQIFRDNFVSLGGKPLSFLVGRVGGVMGAFFVSGVLHDFGLWGMGNGAEFRSVGGFFLAMGLGVVLEGVWKKVVGSRVAGPIGWVWTLGWVIGWGNILVDVWGRKGLIGSVFFVHWLRPSKYIFGALS